MHIEEDGVEYIDITPTVDGWREIKRVLLTEVIPNVRGTAKEAEVWESIEDIDRYLLAIAKRDGIL